MSTPAQRTQPEVDTRAEATRWLGTVLGLSAWAMFFAALVFAVGWYRMREAWPSPRVPAWGMGLTGLLLVAGSVALHLGARREGPRPLWATWGVWASGLAFLVLQAMWMHRAWWTEHLRIPESGVPASAFHGLTALHALHVLAVELGLFACCWRHARGADVRASWRSWTLGWHFVTVTWVFLFVAVYLP